MNILLLICICVLATYIVWKHVRKEKYEANYTKLSAQVEKRVTFMHDHWSSWTQNRRMHERRKVMQMLYSELGHLNEYTHMRSYEQSTVEEECCHYFLIGVIDELEKNNFMHYEGSISHICDEILYFIHGFYPANIHQEICFNAHHKRPSRKQLLFSKVPAI